MPFNCEREYRRSGSLKETNKRLNNKNFTHKLTLKMTSEMPFEQTTEWYSEATIQLYITWWKTRKKNVVTYQFVGP